MYARIVTYQSDPARLDDLIAKLDEIKAQVKAIAGVVDVYSVWRADGNAVTAAIYESQDAAEAAAAQIQAIWEGLADFLISGPHVETYDNVAHLTA